MLTGTQPSPLLHTTLPLPSRIKQIDGLQILRAIAVTLVAWLHAALGRPVPNLGIFGIDIFFVISGFIMSYIVLNSDGERGVRSSWNFLLRRLIRIYPIYWLFAALNMVRILHSHIPSPSSYLGSLTLFPDPQLPRIMDISWTLMFEMFFYFVIALILLFTVRRAVWVVISLFCATALFGSIQRISSPFTIIVCNPILLEFMCGALIAQLFFHFGRRRVPGIAAFALGIAASLYLRLHAPTGAAKSMQMVLTGQGVALRVATWGTAAVLLVGGMVFWSPQIEGRLGRLVVVVGNASYSAYLASILVVQFSLRAVLMLFPASSSTEAWSTGKLFFVQIAQTLAVLIVGWLSYQFVEWPMVRALQRRFPGIQRAGRRPAARTAVV